MDWKEAAVVGLIGGMAGGIAALIGHLVAKTGKVNSKSQSATMYICMALVFSLANAFGVTKIVKHVIFPSTARADQSLARMAPLLKNPRFQLETKKMSNDEVRTYTQNITHLGLKRMSDQDLMDWNRIRLDLANLDSKLCASLWTGFKGDLYSIMAKLPPAEQQRFEEISVSAALLELEGRNAFEKNQSVLVAGLREIGTNLSPGAALKYKSALSSGVNANADDACFAIKSIMTGIPKMPENIRLIFLRNIAAI